MIACRICIATKGLKGRDLGGLPQTQEELEEHLERVHGVAVQRPGESKEQTAERLRRVHNPAWPNCCRGYAP